MTGEERWKEPKKEWRGRRKERKPSGGLMGEEKGFRRKETKILRWIKKGKEGQTETEKEISSDSCYPYMKLNVITAVRLKPRKQLNPLRSYRECLL